jgi:hypothetical protein
MRGEKTIQASAIHRVLTGFSAVGGGTVGRCNRDRQDYLEPRLARPRFHTDLAAMLADDSVDRVETEPRPLTHALGGEERLEKVGLYFGRNIPDHYR